MELRPRDIRRLILLAVLPPALVLLGLVAGGWLAPRPAIGGGIATLIGLVLLLAPWGRSARAVAALDAGEGANSGPALAAAGPSAVADRVLRALPDPILLIDRGRRVVQANAAAETQFGRNAAGRDLLAMVRHPALIDAVDAVLAGQGGREIELLFPVPVERVLKARVEPLAGDGAGPFALIAFQDMTAAKRTDRMRADFVANVSHELRTPLSSLVGFIETLQGPARDDAEARERFLAIMQEQAQRMARLIADLLSLSRIELNEHRPPLGEADLGPILGGLADALALKAAERRMTIRLGAPAPIAEVEAYTDFARLPAVQGERDELTQLFQNLIDNAIKYGRAETPVEIRLGRLDEGWLEVAVRDHGEGIPREHLPRLTERFYRVDSARSRDLGGTGLGLAIVKHILNRHRGRLVIESELGRGSSFSIRLPLAQGPGATEGA